MAGVKWSERDLSYLRANSWRKSVWQMAEELTRVTPQTIYNKCKALGLRVSTAGAPKVPCAVCGKLRPREIKSRTMCRGCATKARGGKPPTQRGKPLEAIAALPPLAPPPAHHDERLLARARQLGECLARDPAPVGALVRVNGWTREAIMAILGECPPTWFGVDAAGLVTLTPAGREALRVGLVVGGA